jgi:hypothetical protein
MPLRVACFSTYRTAGAWRSIDHDSHKFIEAIKGRDLNGYGQVRVGGAWRRYDNANRHAVVGWFARLVADYLEAHPVASAAALVPVPGSRVDVNFEGTPRTAQLAHAIADELNDGTTVLDVLRWRESMPSAHEEGGTRVPGELFENLVLTTDLDEANVILVDDVITSGGHLKACAARLRQRGARVLMAVVAGRADEEGADDPFAVRLEEIGDYEP